MGAVISASGSLERFGVLEMGEVACIDRVQHTSATMLGLILPDRQDSHPLHVIA